MPATLSPGRSHHLPIAALLGALALAGPSTCAAGGKLLLTGGVSSIDGTAGGGLTPWALTGSYATEGQWGGSSHATVVRSGDYRLLSYGASLSWNDRLEFSLARQDLDTRNNLAPLGLPGRAGKTATP